MQIGKHTIVKTGTGYRFTVNLPTGLSLYEALTEVGAAITAFYDHYKRQLKPEAVLVLTGKKFPLLRMQEVKPTQIIYAVEG